MADLGTCHVLVMSIGFFFLMFGFHIIVFIMVLIEGLRLKENYFTALGSLCLIVIYVISALTVLFVPTLISITGPKITMLVGCATHILFVICMVYPHPISMCFASMLVGIGSALLWVSQGNYIVRNSTEKTVSSNCALFWILFQMSVFLSSIFIYFRFLDINAVHSSFRISTFWLLLGLACTSFLFYLLLPSCTREDALSEKRPGIVEVSFGIGKLLQSAHILVLGVSFFLIGANVIILTVAYGLAIGHTMHLERPKQLAPLAGVFIGLGEIVGGGVFLLFGTYGGRSSRNAIVIFGCVILILALILVLLNLPNESPFGDTDDLSLIETSAILVIGSSFLLGLADACFNTQIMTTLALKYPRNSASVFAVFKFFQVFGILVAIIYSAFLILYGVIVILIALSIFATIGYIISETITVNEDQLFDYKQKDGKVLFGSGNKSEKSWPKSSAKSTPPSARTPEATDLLRSKDELPPEENKKLSLEDQGTETPDFVTQQKPHRGFLRRLLIGAEDYEDDEAVSSRPPTPPAENPETTSKQPSSINISSVGETASSTSSRKSTSSRHVTPPKSAIRSSGKVADAAPEGQKEESEISSADKTAPENEVNKTRKSMIKRLKAEPEHLSSKEDDGTPPKVQEEPPQKKSRKRSKVRTTPAASDDESSKTTTPVRSEDSKRATVQEKTTRRDKLRRKLGRKSASSTGKAEEHAPD